MTATRLDITIEQGADYDGFFQLSYDPTGYSAAMQIKLAAGFPYPILTLTSIGGGLLIDGPSKTVTPVIPASVAAAIIAGKYAYDLKLISPAGRTRRDYEGAVYVSPEVTDEPIYPVPSYGGFLLEGGGALLLENGGQILLDDGVYVPGAITLEDGTRLILENGGIFLMENGAYVPGQLLLEGGGHLLNETGGNFNLEA